jgi:hypothetical protein
MFAGAGVMALGAAAMTIPGGQLPGAIGFAAGLSAALYGYGEFNHAEQSAADDASGNW